MINLMMLETQRWPPIQPSSTTIFYINPPLYSFVHLKNIGNRNGNAINNSTITAAAMTPILVPQSLVDRNRPRRVRR